MARRIGGPRRYSRHKFTKDPSLKGKISIRRYLADYKEGDNVCLSADTSVQAGLYPARFHGLIGKIIGRSGRCYKVQVKDHTADKIFIVHPVHLKQVK